MVPRVDLPEVILEVMSWESELAAAFTAVSGGRTRLEDLDISIAACLAGHSMNVGYRPIAKRGVPALERSRLSHVFQNYFRPETIGPANAPLVARQAGLPLAQAWGGGLVAAVDGMRFVVPVPAAFARPNRKFFGPKRGTTWLNALNDQGMGRGAKVVSGTVRDSLHMVDVIFGLDGGELPEIVVTDTGSYSDLVFGISGAGGHLLPARAGRPARPEGLADRPARRLRGVDHLRPRPDRPGQGGQALAGDPASHRLHLHRHRARL